MSRIRSRTLVLGSLLVAVAACGKGNSGDRVGPAQASAPLANSATPPTAPAAPLPPPKLEKVELVIGAIASTMTFDKTTLTVPAGAEVHLVLSDAKPGTLMHNWVLVKPGTEAAVAAAGLPAGPAGNYVTAGPDVLAFTPLAKPGGTSEVTFQAPPPGSYPYICSFPGHYLIMKGTLVVAGEVVAALPEPAAPTAGLASPAAEKLFATRCVVCHGPTGIGDGPGAAVLDPKPRAFSDPAWQASATDDRIFKTIVEGGPAMGKSAGMPPNPDLADKPEVVKELVRIVRAFKKG